MRKYMWGAVFSFLVSVAGLWLMLAPFAFGYQRGGANWADSTKNDFWMGLGIALVSLLGVALFTRSVVAELRRVGVIKPHPAPQPVPAPEAQPAMAAMPGARPAASTSDLERVLLPMATALLADIAERRASQGQGTTPTVSANGRGAAAAPVTQQEGGK
ncbi:MAG: hypothetical protein M1118_01610 [Chloroflexi bacterium]|nr:hypothetical protein [Chloroflexota bacterium]